MTALAYVHKPVVVQAMQVPNAFKDLGPFVAWLGLTEWILDNDGTFSFPNDTDSIEIVAIPGDWVIKDATGGIHYCDDATFLDRYEPLK